MEAGGGGRGPRGAAGAAHLRSPPPTIALREEILDGQSLRKGTNDLDVLREQASHVRLRVMGKQPGNPFSVRRKDGGILRCEGSASENRKEGGEEPGPAEFEALEDFRIADPPNLNPSPALTCVHGAAPRAAATAVVQDGARDKECG